MLSTYYNLSQILTGRCIAVLLAAFFGATVVGCAGPALVRNPLDVLRPVGHTTLLVGTAIGGTHKHGEYGCGCNGEPGYFGYSETCWRAWPEGWVGCPIVVEEMTLDDYPREVTPTAPRELVPPSGAGAASIRVPEGIHQPEDPDGVLHSRSPVPESTTRLSEQSHLGETVKTESEREVPPTVDQQVANPPNPGLADESPPIAKATEGPIAQPAPAPATSTAVAPEVSSEPNISQDHVDAGANDQTDENQTQLLDSRKTPNRSEPAQGAPSPQPELHETAPRQSRLNADSRTDSSVIKPIPSPVLPLANPGSKPLATFKFTPRVEYQSAPPRLALVENDNQVPVAEIPRKEPSWGRIKYAEPFDPVAGVLERADENSERDSTANHIRLVRPFTLR